MFTKFSGKLTLEEEALDARVFDLVIGRVLKAVYSSLDEEGRKNMEKVFLSDSDSEKEAFVKKCIPNFEKLFEEESKKVREEIQEEMVKNFKS